MEALDRRGWRLPRDLAGCPHLGGPGSLNKVTFQSERKCRVETGRWYGAFTGIYVEAPGDLDIDHLVPLKNAHDSGGWAWSSTRKEQYANYLGDPDHLIAVTKGASRSKGAKGPEAWRPPDEGYWCQYATDWREVTEMLGIPKFTRKGLKLGDERRRTMDFPMRQDYLKQLREHGLISDEAGFVADDRLTEAVYRLSHFCGWGVAQTLFGFHPLSPPSPQSQSWAVGKSTRSAGMH